MLGNSDSEKALRAIDRLYKTHVGLCILALRELRSVELADKNIILRAILRDMPGGNGGCKFSVEDCAVDLWADRAEYVDEQSFDLYVTQAEENVLWNLGKKGLKPGRLAVPQQRITVRADAMNVAPFIPVAYLTILGGKLLATAFPGGQAEEGLSEYADESVMLGMMQGLMELLEEMEQETPGDGNEKHRTGC